MDSLVTSAGPHVLVDDVDSAAVAPDDWHHLTRVLRLRVGDPLTVTDGRGSWRRGELGADRLALDDEIFVVPRPRATAVGFALVKGSKPELIVQKLTELGVATIAPFVAERSVVRWDATKQERAHDRLRRIAREAVMQSKGTWLPEVRPVVGFAELVGDKPAAVVRADLGAPTLGHGGAETRMVLVGPEGGWSDDERQMVSDAVGLGDRVLRAETAAIAVGVLLTTR